MSKHTNIVENLISEEVKRFNNINGYVDPLNEQFLGLGTRAFQLEQEDDELNLAEPDDTEEETTDEFELAGEEETDDAGDEFELAGEEETTDTGDEIVLGDDIEDEEPTENVEELDVTELVTMTKEAGDKTDSLEQNIETQKGSIDSLMSKIDDLETKLNDMDNIVSSVENLESKIEKYRAPTPQEKLDLRYLDSGPFNQKISDFWDEKQGEMSKQKDKHEYVLTQQEVDNYNDSDIKKSWAYNEDEEENI